MRCYRGVKKDLADDEPGWSTKRRDRVARAICVKRTGMKFQHIDPGLDSMFGASFTESGKARDIRFSFRSDFKIVEKSELNGMRPGYNVRDPDSKLVVGRASFATTSLNFNEYFADELKKAAKTLIGKTCQVDHSESARDTFGKVYDAWWDNSSDPPELAYIAELEGSDPISAKVQKGYLDGVSVSGEAEQTICSICDKEWDWLHDHTPGMEYDGKTCKRQFKGISFRHLGFTSFPGVVSADANYVAASMHEALENTLAYMNYQESHGVPKDDKSGTQLDEIAPENTEMITTFGETISMSSDQQTELLKEVERAQLRAGDLAKEKAELETRLAETDSLKEELEELQERERKRLISEIIDLQVQLKRLDPKKAEERRADLGRESTLVLEAKISVLKEFDLPAPVAESVAAGSKSKIFSTNSKFQELDPARQEHYIQEAKLQSMSRQMFGHPPSVKAVKVLGEWDYGMDRWKTEFSDLIKTVPKQR